MTCNSVFIGDDLTDIITVNRPTNTTGLTITKDIITVGTLIFEYDNPVYPFKITIDRSKSKKLDLQNSVYRAIYFNDGNGNTDVRRTCLGTLTLLANNQVVPDVED